jgi:ADP-ribosylglycohydrolase
MSELAANQRALLSLHGLAIGDALGGFFEFAGRNAVQRIAARWLPAAPWHWTDDTQMAGAVVATLRRAHAIDQDLLAAELAQRYERKRGYGLATRALLGRFRQGAAWQPEAAGVFGGQGSFGNGAAARVPPLGAYFADDLGAAAAWAARSAVVTHAHPEAQAGAAAVALLAALAWQRRGLPVEHADLLDRVLAFVAPSLVRERLIIARDLPATTTVADAAAQLGNGSQVAVQDTVPFALWCAATAPDDYEAAIWRALSGLGDCDTIAAMVGGIVVLRTGRAGIPPAWLAACEPLPETGSAQGATSDEDQLG